MAFDPTTAKPVEKTGFDPSTAKPVKDDFNFSAPQMVRNIPSSAVSFGKNIVSAVRHPIDTAKALGKTALGGVEKLVPGEQGDEQSFDAMVDFFKQRYGGVDNLKRTAQNDPVGFAADIATVGTGAGAAARVAGLGRTASMLSKVGSMADPINIAAKGVRLGARGAGEVLGMTTGAGVESVKQAFTKPTPAFRDAMRGKTTEANIVQDAKAAIQNLKDKRSAEYVNQLPKAVSNPQKFDVEISQLKRELDKKVNDFGIGVKNTGALGDEGVLDFARSPVSKKGQPIIEEAVQKIRDWGTRPEDFTVQGLDTLKRQLDDLIPETGAARAFITSVKAKVRNTLVNNVADYKKLVNDYEDASNLINELDSTFSMSAKSADTTIRKLNQTLRQNFEMRQALAQKLDEATGGNLISEIAGSQLKPLAPRGLARESVKILGASGAVGAAKGMVNLPAYLGYLASSSPRLVGETLYLLGVGNEKIAPMMQLLKKAAPTPAREVAFQSGRVKQETEKKKPKSLSALVEGMQR